MTLFLRCHPVIHGQRMTVIQSSSGSSSHSNVSLSLSNLSQKLKAIAHRLPLVREHARRTGQRCAQQARRRTNAAWLRHRCSPTMTSTRRCDKCNYSAEGASRSNQCLCGCSHLPLRIAKPMCYRIRAACCSAFIITFGINQSPTLALVTLTVFTPSIRLKVALRLSRRRCGDGSMQYLQ
jgi:hypothetical protein